jgi:nonsense-mediated mRNA decay protein 3
MPKQCPRCGRTPDDTGAFIDGFCPACYFRQHPLIILRRTPQVKVCPRCDSYWNGRSWVPRGDAPLDEYLTSLACDLLDPLFNSKQPATYEARVRDHPEGPIARTKKLRVEVASRARACAYEETKVLELPVTSALCNRCRRSSSGYFEAVLQIRTTSGKLTPEQQDAVLTFLDQCLEALAPPGEPVKIMETRGGIDLKFISGHLARRIAKDLATKFGLISGVSSKVAGRGREGEPLHRESYVLRFPLLRVGDVFVKDDAPYAVMNVHNGRYVLVDLDSGRRTAVAPKELAAIEAVNLSDQVADYQVISETPEFIQLMSQTDYAIYDLPRPPFPVKVGTTIRAIAWKNRPLPIPER